MPSAEHDIKTITDYLKGFSYNIAVEHNKYIWKIIKTLSTMPNRCALVRDDFLKEQGYRWISARNYTIYFTVKEEKNLVRIERVLYSKREYDVIL